LTLGATSYAFFLGSIVSNPRALSELNVLFSVPLLLLSGFYAAAENFLPHMIPVKYISLFKYAFQVLVHMEFTDPQALNCFNNLEFPCDPLKNQYNFLEPFWVSMICILVLIFGFRTLAFIFFKIRSKG
jgi:hypothetical protein